MATIPTQNAPRVRLGQLAGVRPLPSQQQVRVPASAFGEAQAAGIQQAAGGLEKASDAAFNSAIRAAEAERRVRAREDAIKRIGATNAMEAKIGGLISAAEIGGDLGDPDQVTTLRDQISEAIGTAESEYGEGGLPDDRLRFLEATAQARGKWNGHLTSIGIKAGKARMNTAAAAVIAEQTSIVAQNPVAFEDAKATVIKWFMDNYADTATPAELAETLNAGMETLSTAAVDFLTTNQLYDQALAMIEDPTVNPFLTPDRKRELRMKIYAGQGKANEIRAKADARIQFVKDTMGPEFEVTEAMTLAAADIDIPLNTTEQKIETLQRLVRTKTGQENWVPTEEVMTRIAGGGRNIADVNPIKTPGDAQFYLAQVALRFQQGVRPTPTEMGLVGAAIMVATQTGPFGNKMEIPPIVRDMMAELGRPVKRLTTDGGVQDYLRAREDMRQQARGDTTPTRQVLEQFQPDIRELQGVAMPQDLGPAGDTNTRTEVRAATDRMIKTGINYFKQAKMLGGIGSGISDTVSNIYFLGEFFGSPEVVTIRTSFAGLPWMVKDAFRPGDRYAEALTAQLEPILERISPSFFGEPTFFQNALIGLDDFLSIQEAHYAEVIDKGVKFSPGKLEDLNDRLKGIRLARQAISAPPIFETVQEFWETVRSHGLQDDDEVRYQGKRLTVGVVKATFAGGQAAPGSTP